MKKNNEKTIKTKKVQNERNKGMKNKLYLKLNYFIEKYFWFTFSIIAQQ